MTEAGASQDGYLRLHDIFDMRLNADLVVLSACQTALGKEIKGEGLVGLTRGFMYAGAPGSSPVCGRSATSRPRS